MDTYNKHITLSTQHATCIVYRTHGNIDKQKCNFPAWKGKHKALCPIITIAIYYQKLTKANLDKNKCMFILQIYIHSKVLT